MKKKFFLALLISGVFWILSLWITKASNFTPNESKFMELLESSAERTEADDSAWAIPYLLNAQSYCKKSDVYSTFKKICDELPSTIAKSYAIACFDSYQKKKYTEAKDYCYESIAIDNKQYTPYISVWVMCLEEKDYWTAKSYFDAAYANATTEEQRETARQYVEEAHKHMSTGNDFGFSDEVLAILNKSLFCDEGYVYDSKINKCIALWEDCSKWYIYNELKNECVPDTKEQRARNCPARYGKSSLSDNWEDCVCADWYVFDEEADKCLVNLNEKSLESRIMNTKDAKCDDTAVILSCALEPTWNDCPAVCLELYDAINWMYDNELTIYNDPTKFGIYNPITREQASKFFVNFYVTAFDKKDKIIAIPTPNPFKDTTNADPTLKEFILKSFTLKLFKGTNWKFMPFNHLTKAQALAVMIRMATWILDESQQPRYSNYLYKAESMKLLDNINYSYSTLDNEDIVRWDVALILYRLFDYLGQ